MITVALTGGLATGKTTVGRMFVDLGGYLVEADKLGHATLAPGTASYGEVLKEFGRSVLAADQKAIDRRTLASIVFKDPQRLERLNAIVHPAVEKLRRAEFARIADADPKAIVFYEAAIHIETGIYRQFLKLVLVVCREQLQIERAMKRSGLTRDEALERIRHQMPLAAKRKFADYVIDTSHSEADAMLQTEEIYNELQSLVR